MTIPKQPRENCEAIGRQVEFERETEKEFEDLQFAEVPTKEGIEIGTTYIHQVLHSHCHLEALREELEPERKKLIEQGGKEERERVEKIIESGLQKIGGAGNGRRILSTLLWKIKELPLHEHE